MAYREQPPYFAPVLFGGVEFPRMSMPLVRTLCKGKAYIFDEGEVQRPASVFWEVKPLKQLASMGYAAMDVLTGGKVCFKATPALLELGAGVARRRVSFDLFADLAGIDLSPERCRKYLKSGYGEPSPWKKPPRSFPTKKSVERQIGFLTRQGKPLTENDPVEEGDVYQVSSPELTRWYVQQYQVLNSITAHCLVQYPQPL